jgi:hypothetical protein
MRAGLSLLEVESRQLATRNVDGRRRAEYDLIAGHAPTYPRCRGDNRFAPSQPHTAAVVDRQALDF